MNQDARLIHHGYIEWSPVLKERQVEELVVNCEIVVSCSVVR